MDAPSGPETSYETPVRWGLTEVVVGVLAAFSLSYLFAIFWIVLSGSKSGPSLGVLVASSVGSWIALVGVPFLAARNKGSGSLRRDFGVFFVFPRDLWRGALWGFGAQLVLVPLLYVPVYLLDRDLWHRISDPARATTGLASGGGVILLAVCLVLLAPFAEELFFRGLTLRALQSRFPARTSILISSVLFAGIHLEPLQFPALFLFGCILGTLATKNGRLGENICAHAAFNAATVILLLHPF